MKSLTDNTAIFIFKNLVCIEITEDIIADSKIVKLQLSWNMELGANNCVPYTMCYEAMGGLDPDFLGIIKSRQNRYSCEISSQLHIS